MPVCQAGHWQTAEGTMKNDTTAAKFLGESNEFIETPDLQHGHHRGFNQTTEHQYRQKVLGGVIQADDLIVLLRTKAKDTAAYYNGNFCGRYYEKHIIWRRWAHYKASRI